MGFQNYMRMLPLAYTPEDGTSILDWSPFSGGDTLGRIVDDHNARCIQSYQDQRWLPDLIQALGEGINVVLHDLSTVGELHIKDFADIDILLVDLGAIEGKTTEINQIKARMAAHIKQYHLPQVSETPNVESCATEFEPLAVILSRPAVLPHQAAFEAYLDNLHHLYQIAITAMCEEALSADKTGYSVTGRGLQLLGFGSNLYIEALAKLATDIRDRAMLTVLSEAETVTVARRAVAQDSALARDVKRLVRRGDRSSLESGIRGGMGPGDSGMGPGRR